MKNLKLLAAAAAALGALVCSAASAASTAPKLTMWFNPGTVVAGKSTTLHWAASNVTSCSAGGAWSGSQPVSGTQVETTTGVGDTTYTLTCTGSDGSITGSATLQAVPPPPKVYVWLAPGSIAAGKKATLHWSSTNATACTASGAWSGSQATAGTEVVSPASAGSYTYTLNCSGDGGSASAASTLEVTPPPATAKLTVSPGSIVLGQKAMLYWSSTNATACAASGAWSGALATTGKQAVAPSATGTYTYTLTCSGAGASASTSSVLGVTSSSSPVPVVSISANPVSANVGGSSTLSWSSSFANSCTASGAWSGAQSTSGSLALNTATAGSYAYTLTCTGDGGTGSATANFTVNAAPTVSIALNPTSIPAGQSSTLTWSSTNATACTASGAWSGSQNTSGTLSVSPAVGSYTYTLDCSGAGGDVSNSATLTVNPLPTLNLSVSPSSIVLGQSATLTWSSANTTSCTASGAWSGAQATSGSNGVTPAVAGPNAYTLSCTGAGGNISGTATLAVQALVTSIDAGVSPTAVTINQGTAIGQGSGNGATPFSLKNLNTNPKTGATTDANNFDTVNSASNPFQTTGTVPDTAFGFCDYSGSAPKRVSYVTGSKQETTDSDPHVPMSPYYFPLAYRTVLTPNPNMAAFAGGKTPIIGLFDWRPKDLDEGLVVAESDDNGKTWYFMQNVLELWPDYSNPISGGYVSGSTNTGCPATVNQTNGSNIAVNGSTADDGWGHAAIIQLPGAGNAATGQYLYMLDRSPNNVDVAPLWVINLAGTGGNGGASNKFPVWNTNFTGAGNNDMKSISSAQNNSAGSVAPIHVQQTNGLLNPDGIMAVFPTATGAAAGTPVTVMYVQKILNGDNSGATAMPAAQQCKKAPFSGKSNHDISNVRLAQTTDGVNFTDLGVVSGLNDPTTVDYNKTRWVAPRGTLIDVNGDGSLWGLYFSAGNCLDGDSDAFHYIGYAESTDKVNWTVFNGINNPIASINSITTTNQADGSTVTIPANAPLFPTQPWFAQRLYAPTAVQIDSTHLSLTFAGYGVQSPDTDLLNYRQIGNIVLTMSKTLPAGTPNNINSH